VLVGAIGGVCRDQGDVWIVKGNRCSVIGRGTTLTNADVVVGLGGENQLLAVFRVSPRSSAAN